LTRSLSGSKQRKNKSLSLEQQEVAWVLRDLQK
jgi:hypothetical protein